MKKSRTLQTAMLLCVTFFMMAQNLLAGLSQSYSTAQRLSNEKKYAEALDVLQEALQEAKAEKDDYFAFFFVRDISHCHERLGDNNASIRSTREALAYLDKLGSSSRMPKPAQMHERQLLQGLLAKYLFYSHQLTQARLWHERAKAYLLKLVEQDTGEKYDLMRLISVPEKQMVLKSGF